jgi:alpha-amylase/alpha-mannosidase (GH57 family)
MSASVELVLLWHFHQPDYRDPASGRARLPWVRLRAAKDYLDMAERLRRFPGVRATFNFAPILLDQLEGAARGAPDELFERLAASFSDLDPAARRELAGRCRQVPRHAGERWPELRRAGAAEDVPDAAALLALQVWFLLAWLDPVHLAEPAAARALAAARAGGERLAPAHRDDLLALHGRMVAAVLPAYRELAETGQAELSASPYYHPILPLLVDVRAGRRARPDLALPREPFQAAEDAELQLERALARHRELFGRPPAGVWPSEGAVSPETAEIAAGLGVRWLASDEQVLERSLPEPERGRGAHFRPWTLETPRGRVGFLFRDHELSDRIGFVYQRWDAAEAVADFLERLRRIGREHAGERPPVVPVILDGENCWDGYSEDGGPFLDALYGALQAAADVRTSTPSEALERWPDPPRLPRLHTGSWIDADLHVWVGHPEKNRAWDLLSRARAAMGGGPGAAGAREALLRAEGSDWFWWLGEDHYTADKGLFDSLFRGHLKAVYEAGGRPAPLALEVPIAQPAWTPGRREPPIGFIRPAVDGRPTHYYEWQPAGHLRLAGGGGAMHGGPGLVSDLYYGFDLERLFLRLDFSARPPDGRALRIEILEPSPARLLLGSLASGAHQVERDGGAGGRAPLPGAECRIESVLELAVPFAALAWKPRDPVQLLVQILEGGRPVETLPEGDAIRFESPDESFDVSAWSP